MAYNTYVRTRRTHIRARVLRIKVLLYVLRIPLLITLDTYITWRSAEGQYSLRIIDDSRDSHWSFKPSITGQDRALVSRERSYPLNHDRLLNYFSETNVQPTYCFQYRIARFAIISSNVS